MVNSTTSLADSNKAAHKSAIPSPDEDIIMCAHVQHFITTGGGFGNLIKEINEQKK